MLEQTILWRRLDVPGHDACGLWSTESGWRLAGTSVFVEDGQPCVLSYEVTCDAAWRAPAARVEGLVGKKPVAFTIAMRGDRWALDGVELELPGAFDVDLAFTPATNTLALRRLALGVGDRADAPAAWLRFPELTFERLDQLYHRVAIDRYDYRSPSVGYAGVLEVTELGVVTRYPGLWEVEAVT
jgi:hypothetical protein